MKYGFLFLLLALAMAVAAVRGGPWAWLLFYPAFSFGVVSAAYVFSAPGVFGKRFDGKRSKLGTLLVLPYVLYVAAVWHLVRLLSREPKLNPLGDDLVLSRRLLGHELPDDIASVVDLTCEFTEPNESWKIQSYLCYPMLDGTGATANELRELAIKIECCLIDANWGHSTNVVHQFCRQSPHASILLPCHGRFFGASSSPFSKYKRHPGDRVGLNWRVPSVHGKRAIRHVIYDTNWCKSFTHARLAVAMGDRGCLSIFGDRAEQHRMFAELITAEYFIKTEGRGRTVNEWKARPEQPDNHWLDCLVGTAVAASMQGTLLFGIDAQSPRRRERVRFKELQQLKRN